jgi:hypothetical protein
VSRRRIARAATIVVAGVGLAAFVVLTALYVAISVTLAGWSRT